MSGKIGIIGGSGFVGRNLSLTLSERKMPFCVISRDKSAVDSDYEWRHYNPDETAAQIAPSLAGCDCIVNLVGILNKRFLHPNDFERTHVVLTEKILQACETAGVRRYLHTSALNAAADAPSEYLRTKGRAELLVSSCSELETFIFRPSVIFGPRDGLLNRFAGLLKFAPRFFPLACADTLFAPVYVKDVAAVMAEYADADKTSDGDTPVQLCGPEQYTLGEIVEYVARITHRRVKVIALSDRMSALQARVFDFSPIKLFTTDNYLSLQLDSLCTDAEPCPTKLSEVGAQCLSA